MEELTLKLYFLYMIQNKGMIQLMEKISKEGRDDIIHEHYNYIRSIITPEQLKYWSVWSKEMHSFSINSMIMEMDNYYGVIKDQDKKSSTHIQEYIPKEKTVLVLEN